MSALWLPMLATSAAPLDSEEYSFEVKWDGVRALAAVEAGSWRLWGRRGSDYTLRYPELAVLRRLPAGTVVDGELVVLRDGRADFPALLRKHQRCRADPWSRAACPVVSYVLFDLLCWQGQTLFQEALVRRRAQLHELLLQVDEPVLVYSDEVQGCGREIFARAVALGHEGVMAKRRASRYQPGRRSRSWRKIKPVQRLPCVVIGYTAGRAGVHRLLLATLRAGVLCYVGLLHAGLDVRARVELARRLAVLHRSRPVVPCPGPARWVEPELYCQVQCHGWTLHGHLRDAVFCGWSEDRASSGASNVAGPPILSKPR
jgi:bifunctional non-homologous end joining protein LigD